MTVSRTPDRADGELVTVGIVEQGRPRLIPARRDADGHLWREDRRRRQVAPDAIAVVLPGRLSDDALDAARHAVSEPSVAALAARLREVAGDGTFTVQEAVAAEQATGTAALEVWLMLWEHPEWFARAGRTSFRVRSERERAAERERIARRQAEESRLHDAEQALRRLRAGEDSLETVLGQQTDIHEVAETLLDPGYESTLSESLRKRIGQLLEQQYQHDGAAWPFGHYLATALGHRDPWLVGNPLLNRHRRWLEQAGQEPLPEFSGDPIEPWTELVAVDDGGTTERDDAIGFATIDGQTIIEVAVAWLAETIPEHWDEALAAIATTIYLPTQDVPLLPPGAGAQRHSLSPDEARPALLLRWKISDRGQASLLHAEVGHLRLARTCDYEGAADVFGSTWPQAEQVAGLLLDRRSEQGAGDVEIADVMVEVRDGHPVALRRVEPWTGARHVVRELMILTNTTIAERLAARRLPAPFRGLER
ncbi:MAG: RNB domain-containing ribonuclease, partial [Candidatus Dadabacteria bacterium]